jgi:hypothetical protein
LLYSEAADKRHGMLLHTSINVLVTLVIALVSGYSPNLLAEEKVTRAFSVVVIGEYAA